MLVEKINLFARYFFLFPHLFFHETLIFKFRQNIHFVTENTINELFKNYNVGAYLLQQQRTSLQIFDTFQMYNLDISNTVKKLKETIGKFLEMNNLRNLM